MPAKRALSAALALLLAVSFAAPSGAWALSDAGFEYFVTDGAATVTGCDGACPITLDIPAALSGNSVTSIDNFAFIYNELTSVTFLGNAPTAGAHVFGGNSGLDSVTRSATATGWGATWSGVSVVIAGAPRATATVKPTVRGTARVGKTLTAAKGTWTESPTFRYQWYACTTAVSAARTDVPRTCKSIKGATRSTFKLTSKQRNKFVAVRVTGTSVGALATTWLSKTTAKIR